ncbi:sigma-54 interaction domain-containing protein [Peribacillus sp. SCS-155]|uniref:sigma-54 interaction domain-containing protein n=1 Tax=Peribacillus sedimenti TaxID=3115297 RepID=UPI003905886B
MEAILESIEEGIHVIDTNGMTIFYNKVAARHDGVEVQEVLGKPLLEAFPSLDGHSSTLLKVIKTGQAITYKEQNYLNLHGRMVETINTTLPIYVEGRLIGAVEIAKDISALKLLSKRLLELEGSIKKRSEPSLVQHGAKYTFSDIITKDAHFLQIIEQGKKAARSASSVLVYGESGTGKELFVQSIHNDSLRSRAPFIAQNCAALPDTLLDSLLFGTAKGSYTGAVDRKGLFELAHGGTLFLDELQSMPIELQSKLLRVLEDGLVRRIGGTKSTAVDVRVIAAMNIHPEQALRENKLRADLFYRLNIMCYELPALRDRKDDIQLMASYYIKSYNEMLGKLVKGLDSQVIPIFLNYHWPGNVRELKHTIEYMMNIAETDLLTIAELPVFFHASGKASGKKPPVILPLREALRQTERKLLLQALKQTAGNVLQASKILDIPRQTLQYKMKKHLLEEFK